MDVYRVRVGLSQRALGQKMHYEKSKVQFVRPFVEIVLFGGI